MSFGRACGIWNQAPLWPIPRARTPNARRHNRHGAFFYNPVIARSSRSADAETSPSCVIVNTAALSYRELDACAS